MKKIKHFTSKKNCSRNASLVTGFLCLMSLFSFSIKANATVTTFNNEVNLQKQETSLYASSDTLSRSGWRPWTNLTNTAKNLPKAFDGDITTRWDTGSDQDSGQVFGVDMVNEATVSSIVMDHGSSAGDYPRGYAVYIGSDSSNLGTPVATGVGTSAKTVIAIPNVKGRYIKIVLTHNRSGYWSIHEFNVLGTAPALVQIDRTGWQTWANVNEASTPNAIDGSLDTRWTPNTPQIPGQVFGIDMQSVQNIRRVTLDQGTHKDDCPVGYKVYVAVDSSAGWGTPVATGIGSKGKTDISFPDVAARYIKIEQTGSSGIYWSIVEAYVQGVDPAAATPVDIYKITPRVIHAPSTAVQVTWNVGVENNVAQYILERSSNAVNFVSVASIPATGASSYRCIDANPSSGKVYYHIKTIDKDGTVHTSGVTSIQLPNKGLGNVLVYPNPVTSVNLTLRFSHTSSAVTYSVDLFNVSGGKVYQTTVSTSPGKTDYPIRIGKKLASGIYFIKLTNEASGTTFTVKVVAR